MRTVDLRSAEGWDEATIPGSTPAVAILRLHVDSRTGSSSSLVRFPPGWSRPGTGHYEVDEEIVLLDGALTVSDRTYRTGDYGWLPAGVPRTASATADGALALAWFSGPPRWVADDGDAQVTAHQVRLAGVPLDGEGLQLRSGAQGEAWLLPPRCAAVAPCEVLDLATWHWTLLESGDAALVSGADRFARRP